MVCFAWDSNPGGIMVGADKSTDVWWYPNFNFFCLVNILGSICSLTESQKGYLPTICK